MSFLHTATFEESSVKSAQHLTPWKAALAVRVSRTVLNKPGSVYLADLHKLDDLFPDEPKPTGRRDRLNRLYEVPVEVDGLIFQVVKEGSQQRIYGKTRRLTASYGDLGEASATTTLRDPVPMPRYVHSVPSPAPIASAPTSLDQRLMTLERAMTALNDKLDGLEMMYGGAPASTTSNAPVPEALMPVNRRIWVAETNHKRLVDFVLHGKPYEPFVPQTDIPISSGEE